MTRIELLEPRLLQDERALREIDRWLAVMDRPNGWHYDLDILWLLENLERSGVKPGMTILDAGAGLGVTQYVLAARGYRVISLDFARRDTPPRAEGIFDITQAPAPPLVYQHAYASYMRFDGDRNGLAAVLRKVTSRFLSDPGATALAVWDKRRVLKRAVINQAEKRRDHAGFGPIEFVRASFHDMPIPDQSVDAVVSVSAIEHSEKDIIAQAFSEMRRVSRPAAPIMVTTSATAASEDVFHEQTQGHCFTRASLLSLMGGEAECAFDAERVEQEILGSTRLWSRLDPYYFRWTSSLFHAGKPPRLPYLPVGIRLR